MSVLQNTMRRTTMSKSNEQDVKHYCPQCGREMSPVDFMISRVCLKCANKQAARARGKEDRRMRG
jgi:predicted RNA-binding Zn-ribbon protein involved in translation (DUF1610 family)